MIDLEKQSGLPIVLDGETIKPKEGSNFKLVVPRFRKLEAFEPVLKEGSELTGPEIAYTMFKGVSEKNGLEYDITTLVSGSVGDEYVKTIGHYHSKKEGTDIFYPEIYKVIYGKAHYVIQKLEDGKLKDVMIIEAEAGDKVIIPPGYGHITINPTDDVLVESNIQSLKVRADYEDVAEFRGLAFYELDNGKWEKNPNYENIPEPKVVKAKDIKDVFGIQDGVPLYTDFENDHEKFDFLLNPEKYLEEFSQIYS